MAPRTDADDRLLLSVRKPAVVNSTFESLTIGFYTGPNLLEYGFEIKCVNESLSCDAPGEGNTVSGTLPRDLGYVTATVDNLAFNTTYWCYALSLTKKVTKCQGHLVGTTSLPEGSFVQYTLGYQVPPSFFGLEEQRQVCENLLVLSSNGTCVVDTVSSGAARAVNSSEVSGTVEYNSFQSGQKLFNDLSNPLNATLETLATNIVNNSQDVSVIATSFEFVPETNLPGPPGFVLAPMFDQTNATVTWLDGKTGTPEETYGVNCIPSLGDPVSCTDSGINVTGIARGVQTADVAGLTPNTTYSCWAIATNPSASVCSNEPVILRTLIPAGAPFNLQEASVSNETVTIDWTDGLEGNPVETYTVRCIQGTETLCSSSGNETTGLPRGTEQGSVYGLIPNMTYECWVIAENNVAPVCSASPVEVRTWIEAGQPDCPLDSAITNTTVTIDWQDGLQGNPEETYTVNCVQSASTSCTTLELYTSGIARGTLSALVSGLTPNTTYYCYVLAVNPVATLCSVPVTIGTYVEPGAPTNAQNPSISTSWAVVTWDDGALGRPQETYGVNCVPSSGSSSCLDAGVDVAGIARGVQSANVTGLSANTTYSCWPIAGNVIESVCSSTPVINTTWIQPGAPPNSSIGTVSSTSVPFTWRDGAEGNPVETYTILCSTATSVSDCISPGGTIVEETGITRGAESGTVSGLTASTAYKCWVKAVNAAGESCSAGQLVTTAPQLLSSQVISYDQMVSVTPGTYIPPAGATNLTYQAQCLSSSATVCNPQASGTGVLQPSPGLLSPGPISVSGLTNDVLYQCFSVASYTLNSQTAYVCSGPVQVKPFAAPQAITTQSAVAGDQKITVTPPSYIGPSGSSDVLYQIQCLDSTATICNPLANGTGALQPSPGMTSPVATTVTGLTNNVTYQCFSVVTYTLNSQTQYTCSPAFPAIPAEPPTLQTGGVVAGFQKVTITPNPYSLPTGTENVTYQVQCFQGQATECDPSSTLSPSPGLSSPGPIELSSLQDGSVYSCFSVVSYMVNSSERYTCSDQFKVYLPMAQPVNLTAQGVISQGSQMTIYVDAYNNAQSQTNVKYQIQCLDSSATVCNPLATGTESLQPSTPSSSPGFKVVPGLTTNTTYQCFSVVSFTHNVGFRYTCSDPFEVMAVEAPTLTTQKILASSGQLSITPDNYTAPSGGSTVGYQVQCFGSQSSYCDLINDSATPTTALTSPGAITVSGLTNDQAQYCFSVVSYDVNGATRYTCSAAFEAIPFAAPQALTSSNVSPGNSTLAITPNAYTPSNLVTTGVQYQVQCLDSSATVCNPLATSTGALQPTTAQSGLAAITVSGLINAVNYTCFEVVTYLFNSNTKYTCSVGYTAIPQVPAVFNTPYGVANNGNTVFVTNQAGNSVTVCDFDGSVLTNCGAASVGKSLSSPYGISIYSGSGGNTYAMIANQGTNEYYPCTVSGRSLTNCFDKTVASTPLNFLVGPSVLTNPIAAFVRENYLNIYPSDLQVPRTGVRDAAQYLQKVYLTIYSGDVIQQCDIQSSPTTITNCANRITTVQKPNAIVVDTQTSPPYAYVSSTDGGSGTIKACAINVSTGDISTSCTTAYTGYTDLNSIVIIGSKAIIAVGSQQIIANQGIGYPVIVCTINTTGSSPIFTNCVERI